MFAGLAPKEACCGRDKGMLNGCSFNWKHGNEGKRKPRDALCGKPVCYLRVCVPAPPQCTLSWY
jgi:hypothetical protein